jgi:hypothetical protein
VGLCEQILIFIFLILFDSLQASILFSTSSLVACIIAVNSEPNPNSAKLFVMWRMLLFMIYFIYCLEKLKKAKKKTEKKPSSE